VGAGATAFTFASQASEAKAADYIVSRNTRDIPASAVPTRLYSSSWFTFEQTRGGTVRGDALWVIRDMSQSDPYKDETYFYDNGAFFTGRWVVVSQKRFNPIGGNAANGAFIQGVSSVADGGEPSMVSASVDVDGPAFAGESYTRNAAGYLNQSAFSAYDLDSVSGGRTSYSPGYGRKKFVIRGDGGLWWGPDLQRDNWANSDVRLERTGAGALRLRAPKAGNPAVLAVDGSDSGSALQFSAQGASKASFTVSAAGDLSVTVGTATPLKLYADWAGASIGGRAVDKATAPTLTVQGLSASSGVVDVRLPSTALSADALRTSSYDGTKVYSGVDRNGAFFDLVKTNGAGPPTSGTWNVGSCVLNTADSVVYWCVAGGTPGTWKSAALS
jgi:hypothetical protein